MSSIQGYIRNLKSSSGRATKGKQRKHLGSRHWIRLIFLILFTVLLTWYSKQKYNNPFTPWPTIKIIGNNNGIYINCLRKVKDAETNTLLFFLSSHSSNGTEQTPRILVDISTLITLPGLENVFSHFKSPPSNWIILGDSLRHSSKLDIPFTWPTPVYTNNFNTLDKSEIFQVYPLSDTTPCIHFSYANIEMLIVNNITDIPEHLSASVFKEKYDIVIFCYSNETNILRTHKLLRPQYSINLFLRDTSSTIQSLANIIKPDWESFTIDISKDKKNKVFVTQQKLIEN